MNEEGLALVDRKIVDLADARVPLLDRGYLLGDGVFETMRTSNGRVFRPEDHRARIGRGLKAIGLEQELLASFDEATAALVEAGRERFGGELYVRVQVTGGTMEDIGEGSGVQVTGLVRRFKPYPMSYYAQGVSLIVSKHRKDTRSPLAGVKSLSFLPYVAARREAMTQTAHDAILLNEEGRVAEATTSNLFAYVDGVVHAPGLDEGALPGVTRQVVLELIKEAGLEVEESLDLADLRGSEEAWLTNTTGGIVPVTRVQDEVIGKGAKGELTTRLGHALEDLVRGA